MVIAIAVVPDFAALSVDVTLSGLTIGTKYDVHRLQLRYYGDDPDTGVPYYEREIPDNEHLWTAVAHRVGWTAGKATTTFRDYEPLTRPFAYFVVESSLVGPRDFDWENGDYPLTRGVLDDTVIHFNRTAEELAGEGGVLMRSTSELGLWVATCVYDYDVRYVARGTELPVLKRRYPLYIADTREVRRGTLVLKTTTLGQYQDLRRIVFPQDGRIRPVILNGGGDPTLLLDDLVFIPLDVSVEQATHATAATRWVTVDYVETKPSDGLLVRAGDNDDLVNPPKAILNVSDATPARGTTVTLTSASTGQFDKYDWTISRGSTNDVAKFHGPGPYKIRWANPGKRSVKLRVYGVAGASIVTKVIEVH